jgi:hypothetical protein
LTSFGHADDVSEYYRLRQTGYYGLGGVKHRIQLPAPLTSHYLYNVPRINVLNHEDRRVTPSLER